MQERDRGFTLVEVIVVLAIISILITVIATSVSLVYTTDTKAAANTFASLLSACRVAEMSGEDDPRVVLEQHSDGNYYGVLYVGSTTNPLIREQKELGPNTMELSFVPDIFQLRDATFRFDGTGALAEPSDGEVMQVHFASTAQSRVSITVQTGYIEIW